MIEFPNIEAFYDDDDRRRYSAEADFGIWWIENEEKRFPYWRVSYLQLTGEVYALEMGDKENVKLLGVVPTDEDTRPGRPGAERPGTLDRRSPYHVYYETLDRILEGWSEMRLKPLSWVVERQERERR